MSAWRSPLLFLGFVLIAIAAAALFAPLFVDWNSYRAELEDYGRKVTGRNVTIAGPIEARLFPWPALVLNQVMIANREGARRANFMEARRIEMGMSLAPLMSGQVEVDTIALVGPVFAFERLASGAASWSFDLDQSLAALIDPDRVAVAEISISDGIVFAGDHRREGLGRIDRLAGTVSAPSLAGPWRMRATASHRGSPFEISLTTGKLVAGEATRVGLRIAPVEVAGAVYSFDGEIDRPEGRSLKGAIKISPTRPERGKGDAETGLPAFEVKAEVEADFDSVTLTGIEASPAFSTDPGNFITGAATIDLGARVLVEAALSTARIDLDQIAGPRGRDLLRSAGPMKDLGLVLADLPETLDLHVDLTAASVVVGGEMLDASRLKFALSPERLHIEEFTTALPGQTRTRFSGLLLFGGPEPLLSGDISLESTSLRDFTAWALPDQRRAIEDLWSGVRGKLALTAKVDLAAEGIRLSDVDAVLDDARFSGGLSFNGGSDPQLALRIDADRFDLDRYLPRGFGGRSGEEAGTLAGTLAGGSRLFVTLGGFLGEAMALGDFQLTAQAGELRFNGVSAQDVAIDLGANAGAVELRTVEIGEVGGARLDIAGVVSFPGEGVAGSINALIDAEKPHALLRLLGAIGPEDSVTPAWARALGPLDVKLLAEASTDERVTTASVALGGTAGGANATVEGKFNGDMAHWQDGQIELSGKMDSPSSALLAAFTGLELDDRPDRPTRLSGSLAGSLSAGLATTLEADVFGARGQFLGTLQQGRRAIEAHGRLAVLAEDAAELFAIVGVPADSLSPQAHVLAAESDVRYDGRGLRLSTLSGTAGGASFSGDLNFVSEPVRRVSGEIATDHLSLPWLLGAVLLPRDGTPHALSSYFASAVPGMEAELAIAAQRLDLLPHMAVQSSKLELKVGRYDLKLNGSGSGPAGEPATGWIQLELDSRGVAVEGAVEGPVALGRLLLAGDGSPVIDADGRVELNFAGSGRSPAGLLAGLRGEGSYELARGLLKRLDPESFARDLAAAKQPAEIDRLFTASLRSGDMAFMGGSGSLTLADGVLQAKALPLLGQGLSGEARFLLEAASGDVDLSFTLALDEGRNIPTFELAYAGSPRALQSSTDAQNLKSYLSMRMLQDSVQQLEELQRQEQELIEEEKRFQRDQERRERQRREAERREAERNLDRKQLEVAARLRAERREAEARKVEERKGDREQQAAKPQAVPFEEPVTSGEAAPTGEPALLPEPEPEPQFEPEPAAARSDAPAVAPPDDRRATTSDADAAVPVPMRKPERRPAPASSAALNAPVQLPADGNLGRVRIPVFSGPAIEQPQPSVPHSAPSLSSR